MTKAKSKILIIYTGGTIGMIKDFGTGTLKAFNFDNILKSIPELSHLDCELKTISFPTPIDSSNMNPDYWVQIAEIIEEKYIDFDGFVVLHGTDTMSYSASALSFMLENLCKPVIFTGSQLPIGDLRTDAKENLITSIQLASLKKNGKPIIREVGLYFEYKLYRGNRTTKINAEQFEAFSSPNYHALAESGVHLNIHTEYLIKPGKNKKLIVHKELDSNIALIKLFPGISKEAVSCIFNNKAIKGVLLETYGAGNAPTEKWFTDLIEAAIENGTIIVNVTQCPKGSVEMGRYETSSHLKKIGIISGNDITTEAAIAKLMYLFGAKIGSKVFKTVFETELRGEMN